MIEEIEKVQPEVGLICPRCEATNLPERKFCVKCGASLWEPCLQCGEISPAGENFCGVCGASLAEAAAEQLECIGDAFRAAAEMQAASRFDEAIALLAPVAENRHPRLIERAQRAAGLIRQLTAERQRGQIVAEDAVRRAQERLDACDNDGALRVLNQVPPPLRNEQIESLLATIDSRRQEIASLEVELREAVNQNRILDLPIKIECLLAHVPDHPYARSLADQVRDRLLATAEKRLAAHRYDDALQLIEQIAPTFSNPESQELHRRASELAWLAYDLRHAPTVDPTLSAVAERLQALAPDDPKAAKLGKEVESRLRRTRTPGRLGPAAWAPAPQETALGVPVGQLSTFRRLNLAETVPNDSTIFEFPGRFAVACGLAISGLDRAAVRINLPAVERSGALARVAGWVRRRSAKSAWGLDLGPSSLKAVKLVWDETKNQATIADAVLVEHAKSISQAANEAEAHRLASESLQKFLANHTVKGDRVCASLPGRLTLLRQFDLPPVDAAKAPKLVEFEAQQQFPFSLDQLTWDYQLLDDPACAPTVGAKPSGNSWRRAILVGAQQDSVRRFLDAFRQLGIPLDIVQPDFIAVHNFLVYDQLAPADNASSNGSPSVVAALDIGCDMTYVVVSSPHTLWCRNCGVAGQSVTRALVKEFKLSIAQAEARKRAIESADCFSDVHDAMASVFEDLLKEIQRSLYAYNELQTCLPVEQVLGLGGGFYLHGLFRYLRFGR